MKQLIFFILLWSRCLCKTSSNIILFDDNNFNSLDLERIKNKLFSNENRLNFFGSHSKSVEKNFRYDEAKCEIELSAIGASLQSADFWAIKRKLNWKSSKNTISGTNVIIFENENSFGFLGESTFGYFVGKCIWIWCVQSMLSFRTWRTTLRNPILSWKIYLRFEQHFNQECGRHTNWFIGWHWTWYCSARYITAVNNDYILISFCIENLLIRFHCRPKNGQTVTIGICLPDICSPIQITKKVERVIGLMFKNLTFDMLERSCQFEENFNQFTAADCITMLVKSLLTLVLSTVRFYFE